ncbi:MAG TPA: (2Fe-2S)-binding protein [Polyangiaceae bacterium]|nr:(2Fe-2S)-binding protein [Polyangiaceae bacterium]
MIAQRREQPLVLVALNEWKFPSEVAAKHIRAELRGLGASLVIVSASAVFCFRPDDEAHSAGLDDAGMRRLADSLCERYAVSPPAAGLTLVLVDADGRERWRTNAPARADLCEALLEALSEAGRSVVEVGKTKDQLIPPDSLVRTRFSRRESVVLCLAAALAAALGESCKRTESRPRPQPSAAAKKASPTHEREIVLRVNGAERRVRVEPRVSLLDALRERMGLTGTKKGCDHGQCGACAVLVDGRRVNSCLTLAVMVENKAITTIEGLASGSQLHPLQQSFASEDALQCGYCTPGQIMSALGLLHEGYATSDDDIREMMSGNICRCGAYANIVRAVQNVRKTGLPA